MKIHPAALLAGVLIGVAPGVFAQAFIYPKEGQSPEQQQKDQGECDQWARGQTGYGTTAQAAAPPPPQPSHRGGVLRGAARGAALGEVVDDDWETGAAAGALVGGMRRRDANREQQAAYQQQQQQAAAQQQQVSENYQRAYQTCLEARGYSVG